MHQGRAGRRQWKFMIGRVTLPEALIRRNQQPRFFFLGAGFRLARLFAIGIVAGHDLLRVKTGNDQDCNPKRQRGRPRWRFGLQCRIGIPNLSLIAAALNHKRPAGKSPTRFPVGRDRWCLFLYLVFGIDDIVLAPGTTLAVLAGPWTAAAGSGAATGLAAGAALLVEVLRHGMRGLLQLLDGLPDGVRVILAGVLPGLVDGGLDGGAIAVADLAGVLLEELFHLVDHLVRVVAGVDELELALVLVGMGLGFAAHALHVGLADTAGAFDADLLFLAGAEVLGGDVEDAVGVDVEGDLDLRQAARRRRDVLQVELAQQAVARAFGNRAFTLEDAHRDRRLVVLGGRGSLLLCRRGWGGGLACVVQDAPQRFDAHRTRRDRAGAPRRSA